MRAKAILNLALGLFVVAAVALIGWQSMSGRNSASSAAAVSPGAEATVPASVPEAPVAAAAAVVPIQAAVEPVVEPPAATAPAGSTPAAVPAKPAPRKVVAKEPKVVAPVHKVVAMYFHGDVRCTTCRKVESYAKEAVESGFGEQVAAGLVEFRPVNVDREENRHFLQDYQLTNKSVVVVDEVDGSVKRWVKLDNVWGLVGNHDAYLVYVQDAVRAYVEN